jgi:glycosyl-4,4'-diaponeurosporenoate acyltransferase
MIISLSDTATVAVDVAVWAVLGVTIGYLHHRLPTSSLATDGPVTSLRRFETGGTWYQRRLRIRSWKDRLPEAGAVFSGGLSKRRLPGSDRQGLALFVRETRRAERVHWWLLAATPWFILWNRPLVASAMVLYGVVANLPFIAVQRFNRGRASRALSRLGRAERSPRVAESAP